MHRSCITASVAFLCCTLVACGHLDRPDAASQIRKKVDAVSVYTYVGTVSRNCKGESVTYYDLDPIEDEGIHRLLSAAGYITIAPVKAHVWTVQLTDLGKKAAGEQFSHLQGTDCDAWTVPIDLATVDSVDIMGIVEDGVNAKVEASVWFALTPVTLAIRKQDPTFNPANRDLTGDRILEFRPTNKDLIGDRFIELRKYNFVKYDDGWRIE